MPPIQRRKHRRQHKINVAGGFSWSSLWDKIQGFHRTLKEKKPVSKLLGLVPSLASAQYGPVPVGSILTGLRDYAGYGKMRKHRGKK